MSLLNYVDLVLRRVALCDTPRELNETTGVDADASPVRLRSQMLQSERNQVADRISLMPIN